MAALQPLVSDYGCVRLGDAAETGSADESTDVVVGEAIMTMQGEKTKHAIVSEASRLLRPGGRYAIHELALTPDDLPSHVTADIRQALARAIKVNARPLTRAEWHELLASHGLLVDHVETAPMALLQPRRLISDEGVAGALRFAGNLLTHPRARRRVLAMRRTFCAHQPHLGAIAIVARKPAAPVPQESPEQPG